MRRLYDTWLAEPINHQYTRGGNLKPPSRSLLCEWVKCSWEAIPVEIVQESFLSCAITTATNGSDDDKVQCFKSGQPCEVGRSLLHEETRKIVTASDENDQDPFASDTDKEETEHDEVAIEEDNEEEQEEHESDN